jgi:hypothetical protein
VRERNKTMGKGKMKRVDRKEEEGSKDGLNE